MEKGNSCTTNKKEGPKGTNENEGEKDGFDLREKSEEERREGYLAISERAGREKKFKRRNLNHIDFSKFFQ